MARDRICTGLSMNGSSEAILQAQYQFINEAKAHLKLEPNREGAKFNKQISSK